MSTKSSENNNRIQILTIGLSLSLHIVGYLLLQNFSDLSVRSENQPIELVYKEPSQIKSDLYRTVKELHLKELNDQLSKLEKEVQVLSESRKSYKKQIVAKKRGLSENKLPQKKQGQTKEIVKDQAQESKNAKVVTNSQGEQFYVKPSTKSLKRPSGLSIPQGDSSFIRDIPNVKMGNLTLLNSDQFTYYAFFHRLNNNFANRWAGFVTKFNESLNIWQRNALANQKNVTRIEAVLDPKGELLEVFIHESSGVKGLDLAVLKAIDQSAPAPNPPEGLVEEDGLIHLHYSLEVQWQKQYAAQSPDF